MKKWIGLASLIGICVTGCHATQMSTVHPIQVKMLAQEQVTLNNQFIGEVVAQKSVEIQKDSQKQVKEIFVQQGQTITKGQPLFQYDVDQLSLQISKLELEIQSQKTLIEKYQSELAYTQGKEKRELELSIQESQLDVKTKQLELDALNHALENNTVYSELDGVVQELNISEHQDNPIFMKILQQGAYRIKGSVNEFHLGLLNPQDKVKVFSRIDQKTWLGTIDKVDLTSPETQPQNEFGLELTRSNRYPFYVTLENTEGLFLGQHVLVSPDIQLDFSKPIIPSSYVEIDKEMSVYRVNKQHRLEKVLVEGEWVGEYLMVENNLELEDWIVVVNPQVKEGMEVVLP